MKQYVMDISQLEIGQVALIAELAKFRKSQERYNKGIES